MHRTFNNGIGMILVIPEKSTEDVMDRLKAMNEPAFFIGEVTDRKNNEAQVQWI
jgi:phosphoribosylformylglycinamidine cyclo-ligase